MLQRLLGHTTLMITNRYCQAVGCYDTVEAHKRYSPVDNFVVHGVLLYLDSLLPSIGFLVRQARQSSDVCFYQ